CDALRPLRARAFRPLRLRGVRDGQAPGLRVAVGEGRRSAPASPQGESLAGGAVIGRREFLTAGAAAGAALALPRPAAGQAKPKVSVAYLTLGWAACEIVHKAALIGRHGW